MARRPVALAIALVLTLTLGVAIAVAASPSLGLTPVATASQPASIAAASPAPQPSTGAQPSRETEDPEKDEPAESNEPDDASGAAHALAQLAAAGIPTPQVAFQKVVDQVGVGSAVRVMAFAKASGKTPDEIIALFRAGAGWGKIAKSLNLSVGPGIGWIMSAGHGSGASKVKGHSKSTP